MFVIGKNALVYTQHVSQDRKIGSGTAQEDLGLAAMAQYTCKYQDHIALPRLYLKTSPISQDS